MIRWLLYDERWTTVAIIVCILAVLVVCLVGCTAEQKEKWLGVGRELGKAAAAAALEKYKADHPDAIPEEAEPVLDLLPGVVGALPGAIWGIYEMSKRRKTEAAVRAYSDTFDAGETSDSPEVSAAFNGVRAFMKGARLAATSNPNRTLKRQLMHFDRVRHG